jgi:predicted TIM-barrel fold metal-dependent hydrolase
MTTAVDSHVHVWTDDTKRYPRARGERDYTPARFTPEDLFAHTKPAGVSRIVLIQMSFYLFDNSYMLDSMKAHPGVFGGVGIVDEAGPDPVRAMEELAQQGVRGFRIVGVAEPKTWLDSPGMQRMWQTAAARNLAMCALVGPDGLPALDRMCVKYPNTPVVIDHFARIGGDGFIRDPDVQLLIGLARHRNVKVKASAYYALGKKKAPYTDLRALFRSVLQRFGPRRVMWGSDCPFQVQNSHQYAPSIALVREHMPFLSAADREWVLSKSAEATFFRP